MPSGTSSSQAVPPCARRPRGRRNPRTCHDRSGSLPSARQRKAVKSIQVQEGAARVKVSSTELPPRQVSLDIEVEQERLDRAVDDAFRRLAGRVDVPGFRRGKAPRSMIERMLGRDRIVEEALDKLVPEVVSEAIEQEKVEPYTRPRVESIELDPLRLKAIVGLAPKVELGDYKGALKIESEKPNIGEDQVEAVIQRLRDSYAQWAPVDRPVQLADRVGLDLKAVVDGGEQPLLDSKEAEYVVDPEG